MNSSHGATVGDGTLDVGVGEHDRTWDLTASRTWVDEVSSTSI